MSKSKPPRRKYDPNRLNRGLDRALIRKETARQLAAHRAAEERAGMMNLSDEALTDLGIAYRMAFQLMRQHGGEEHFHTLAAAINIAGRFCEMGIGAEFSKDIEAAIGALNRVRERGQRTGRWALDGEGLQQVALSLDIHDSQMESVSCNELRAAIDEVFRLNESHKPVDKLAA